MSYAVIRMLTGFAFCAAAAIALFMAAARLKRGTR